MFGALALYGCQQLPCSGEPAGCLAHPVLEHQVVTEPEREPGGPHALSGTDRLPISRGQDVMALVIPSDQVGSNRVALQVVDLQRGFHRRLCVVRIRLTPRPLRVVIAGLEES